MCKVKQVKWAMVKFIEKGFDESFILTSIVARKIA
jgi:hypothetical protein